jgi:hypothetical protein
MTLRPASSIPPSLDLANWFVDDRDSTGGLGWPGSRDGRVQLTAGQGAS